MGSSSDFHINDFSPILDGDQQSELQNTKELSYLFDYVLNGYGVPFQLRKFIWKILIFTKPGKTYALNDYQIAEQLGGTTRNYVCNLRRKLKQYYDEDRDGIRNYKFISITENVFDVKAKQQKPTEYTFSLEFFECLQFLIKKAREHRRYRDNWIVAIKEAVDGESRGRLMGFGSYSQRPKKRPRTPDDILGTLLLNWKRITQKIIEFNIQLGFSGEEAARKLHKTQQEYLVNCLDAAMAAGPTIAAKDRDGNIRDLIPIRGTNAELEGFFSRAKDYVFKREEVPDPVVPMSWKSRTGGNGDVWSYSEPSEGPGPIDPTDSGGSGDAKGTPAHKVLEHRSIIGLGGGEEFGAALDSEAKRYLARHPARAKKRA